MSAVPHVVLVFNLLQDVNILRPLAYLTAREFDAKVVFLVSSKFLERDKQRNWQLEIAQVCADVGGDTHIYSSPLDAFSILQGKGGVIFAGSESSLSGHADTHYVFQVAPASFLKVTLQHGHECVGFFQNREHDIAHGRDVTFGADVVCGWCAPASLKSLAYSERSKLYVTGPSSLLQVAKAPDGERPRGGVVCENLHSVRLRMSGAFGASFMEIFFQFCERLRAFGAPVNLRPHPGGQYVIKNKVALPDNVVLQNEPIYKTELSAFDFGISAPSSVLIDLLLAEIPVAVWRDPGGVMDTSSYSGLTVISSLQDWLAFARDAVVRRDVAMERQRDFMNRLEILTDRTEIYRRFALLIAGALDTAGQGTARRGSPDEIAPAKRPKEPRWPHAVRGRLSRSARPISSL